MDTWPPAIYCVHLESSHARRERMKRRFDHHGLAERAQLIPAFAYSEPRNDSDEWKAMAGRHTTASHVECMRRMLAEVPESEGGAVICEDDALFHDEFRARYGAALANLPEGAHMMLLGFMVWGRPELVWSGAEPERHNLVHIIPGVMWGAHGYWISHAFARTLVERLGDVPIPELSNMVEEQLTFPSGGHAVYPPLMLQESVESVVRPDAEVYGQARMQEYWPYREYAAAEPEPPISPLADLAGPDEPLVPSAPPPPLLEELVAAQFAMRHGSLELEGVELGTVTLEDGRILTLEACEDGSHRLRADGGAQPVETSQPFRFADLGGPERGRGVGMADGMLVFGFETRGGQLGLAACELEAALALLRPSG